MRIHDWKLGQPDPDNLSWFNQRLIQKIQALWDPWPMTQPSKSDRFSHTNEPTGELWPPRGKNRNSQFYNITPHTAKSPQGGHKCKIQPIQRKCFQGPKTANVKNRILSLKGTGYGGLPTSCPLHRTALKKGKRRCELTRTECFLSAKLCVKCVTDLITLPIKYN